jgi:hypothetical protein
MISRMFSSLDLAQICTVRCRSADGIKRRAANDQIEIGTVRGERIVSGRIDREIRFQSSEAAMLDPRDRSTSCDAKTAIRVNALCGFAMRHCSHAKAAPLVQL